MQKKSVRLLLEPGTKIPNWIKNQTLNIEIGKQRFKNRLLRLLEIRKGEASFAPGGVVLVKMPGSDEWWVGFDPLKVLEIRDLKNKLFQRNHHLCNECGTLTGKGESHKPSDVAGREDITFRCTECKGCWEVKRT